VRASPSSVCVLTPRSARPPPPAVCARRYADPVLNKLDPHRMIPYRLYRQDTQYADGEHVRDLSKLNRDISQVLFLSADPHAYAFQPQNALKLRRWGGDFRDTTLLDIMPLLQMVALRGVQDVRDVVRSYDGEEDVAAAFKRRMAELQSAQKQKAAAAAAPAKPRSALLGR